MLSHVGLCERDRLCALCVFQVLSGLFNCPKLLRLAVDRSGVQLSTVQTVPIPLHPGTARHAPVLLPSCRSCPVPYRAILPLPCLTGVCPFPPSLNLPSDTSPISRPSPQANGNSDGRPTVALCHFIVILPLFFGQIPPTDVLFCLSFMNPLSDPDHAGGGQGVSVVFYHTAA